MSELASTRVKTASEASKSKPTGGTPSDRPLSQPAKKKVKMGASKETDLKAKEEEYRFVRVLKYHHRHTRISTTVPDIHHHIYTSMHTPLACAQAESDMHYHTVQVAIFVPIQPYLHQ